MVVEPMDTDEREELLRSVVLKPVQTMQWHKGIAGLFLNLDFLQVWGADHKLLNMMEYGVDLEVRALKPKFRKNHPSLTKNAEAAHEEWRRQSDEGKVTWLGRVRPEQLNVNPCALILTAREDGSVKSRLILDLLKGLVNERVRKWSVSYGTVELATSRLQRGSYLFVVDLADCFGNWKIKEVDTWELGFFDEFSGEYGKYDFCPNGLAPAPGINDTALKEILRVMSAHLGFCVTDFVDDLLGGGADYNAAWARFGAVVTFLSAVGLGVASKRGGL